MQDEPYTIKLAAYAMSSPKIASIDWTLDCLSNVLNPNQVSLDNNNFSILLDQVRVFNPDLIISDLEYFTSEIGNYLNKPVWQCSSSMINYALTGDYKHGLGIHKKYSYLYKTNVSSMRLINIQNNAERNLIYSHFGDCKNPPTIKENYEWVRPYHQIGKISKMCQHQIVAATLDSNKKFINFLKNCPDTTCFSEFEEIYPNPIMKNLDNQDEYFCNIKNCSLFACMGHTGFLADAFYNHKFSLIYPDIQNLECVINEAISEKLGLSASIHTFQESNIVWPEFNNIKYLHEKLKEL